MLFLTLGKNISHVKKEDGIYLQEAISFSSYLFQRSHILYPQELFGWNAMFCIYKDSSPIPISIIAKGWMKTILYELTGGEGIIEFCVTNSQ